MASGPGDEAGDEETASRGQSTGARSSARTSIAWISLFACPTAAPDQSQRELNGRPQRTAPAETSVCLRRVALVPHQKFSRGGARPSRRRDSEPRVRWSRLCEGALSRAVLLRSAAGTCLRSCSYSRSLRTRLNGMGRWISLPLFLRINTNTFIAGKSNPLWQSRFRIQNRLDLISVPVCGDTGIFYISLADPRCPSRSTSR